MTRTAETTAKTIPGTKAALLIAALLAGSSGAALAGQPGKDWMPMDQVVRKLGEAGYGEIRSLKADDGRWEGKGVKDGQPVSFTVDPQTGAVAEKVRREKNDRNADEDDD